MPSKEYNLQYRKKNKERLSAYSKDYYWKNKDRIKLYMDSYTRPEESRLKKNKKQKEYALNNREEAKRQQKKATLKKKYGLSIADVERLISAQNNTCPICQREFKDKIDPCVDHCHYSNKIRGILCRQCNAAVGQLGDTKEALERAFLYLSKEI